MARVLVGRPVATGAVGCISGGGGALGSLLMCLPILSGRMAVDEAIRKRLRAVPEAAGVYLLRDRGEKVIYVGKALRLRDRLRSYFAAPAGQKAELMKRVFDFELVRTANEDEALAPEDDVIKRSQPR